MVVALLGKLVLGPPLDVGFDSVYVVRGSKRRFPVHVLPVDAGYLGLGYLSLYPARPYLAADIRHAEIHHSPADGVVFEVKPL